MIADKILSEYNSLIKINTNMDKALKSALGEEKYDLWEIGKCKAFIFPDGSVISVGGGYVFSSNDNLIL
jgi:shikimate kinase